VQLHSVAIQAIPQASVRFYSLLLSVSSRSSNETKEKTAWRDFRCIRTYAAGTVSTYLYVLEAGNVASLRSALSATYCWLWSAIEPASLPVRFATNRCNWFQ